MPSNSIIKTISIRGQILLWLILLAFWIAFSIDYHPTLVIDVIVTSVLLVAYASAIYLNHLILIPRFFRSHSYLQYFGGLLVSMAALTFLALFAIRATYFSLWDPNQIGDYWQHYALDLFGMIVHVAAAALLLWIISRIKRPTMEKLER